MLNYEEIPEDLEKEDFDEYFNSAPSGRPSCDEVYEIPQRGGDEEPPPPELKTLPEELMYEFLDETKRYPVIVNFNLSHTENEKLMSVLKTHRKALVYLMDDLKGISPLITTHRIYMEEGDKPVIEHQRRLNPMTKEVVRKEVMRLLDTGIIYAIEIINGLVMSSVINAHFIALCNPVIHKTWPEVYLKQVVL